MVDDPNQAEPTDSRPIEFSILGPLEVRRDGAAIRVPGGRRQLLLLELILEWGRPLPNDVIVDRLWGDQPPASATKTVQKYVWDLRRLLGSDVDGFLATEGAGYVLRASPDVVDAHRFEALVNEARARPPHEAIDLLQQAEALWRGRVLEGLADRPEALAAAQRLDELRTGAVERRLGLMIDIGRHAETIAELERLTLEHPLREELVAHLMVACARAGRRQDALAAFERARLHLAEELGIEPSSRLKEIEHLVLAGDESLVTSGPGTPMAPPRRGVGVPSPVSSFVGRSTLLEDIGEAFASSRLITLTGAGGSGKTRLAIESTHQRLGPAPDGAWFVDLSPLSSDDPVDAATAAAVGLPNQPDTDPTVLLLEAIGSREFLLILDNCEHVLRQAAELLDALLSGCPKLHVVATSREPLGLPGERVLPVPPLSVPDPTAGPEEARRFEAVELFVSRARDRDPTFELDNNAAAVVEICTRLDGIPLALELAAAQVHAISPTDLATLLDDRFRILRGAPGRPPRQATLRAAIDWSHERLGEDHARLFRRVSVFPGSFDLAAAAAVAEDDRLRPSQTASVLSQLVNRSMIVRADDHGGRGRYRLLDTLREYGRERLADAGEARGTHLAHALHFAQLAMRHATPKPSDGDMWHLTLGADYHNLQAALAYACEANVDLAADMVFDMSMYWTRTDQVVDGLRYVEPLVVSHDLEGHRRAAVLCTAAELRAEHGEAVLAAKEAAEALALFEPAAAELPAVRARYALGRAKANAGEFEEAEKLLELAQRSFAAAGDVRWGSVSNALGSVRLAQGDHDGAWREYENVLVWAHRHDLVFTAGKANWLLGVLARHRGDLTAARTHCQRAHVTFVDIDDRSAVAHVRMTLGDIARLAGKPGEARMLYDNAFEALSDIGDRRCTASALKNLADLERGDDPGRATRLYLECLERRWVLGDRWGAAEALEGLAAALVSLGLAAAAVPLLAHAGAVRDETGAVLPDDERRAVEGLRRTLETTLSDTELDRLWSSGRALGLDEAVASARAAVASTGSL